ncbi:MAG: ATP-binding cassette domain-containing protein [Chitinivibrionales bacterium]|nr:ATP-binding cassette domain-containing protein [Chitinivibrionales bacterium]
MMTITNLKKCFEHVVALDIDTLNLAQGMIHAIIGHNGSGKTTLIRILSGLDKASSGQFTCSAGMKPIAVCLQKPYLFYGTVEQNVRLGIALRKERADERRIKSIVKRLRIAHLMSRPAKLLSAGEMQRVSLARALALEPAALLLDEPTANLDPESRQAIERELFCQKAGGVTCILTTHQIDLAHRLGDTITRLESGRKISGDLCTILAVAITCRDSTYVADYRGTRIFLTASQTGKARIAIAAKDVVISQSAFDSSMLNQMRGVIKSICQRGSVIEVEVDIGFDLLAAITEQSLCRLNLVVGTTVYISFKAASVEILSWLDF